MSKDNIVLKDVRLIPNLWTSLQFVTLPMMLYFAWMQNLKWFIFFYLLTFFIDSTDGMLARRLNMTSKLGMYLDTYLDFAMYVLVSISLYLFIPEFLSDYIVVLIALFSVTILSRILSFIRFGRALMLHLYSSKMMYFFLTLFIVDLFVSQEPSSFLFIILLVDAALFVLEELLIVLRLKEAREDILSVFELD